MIEWEGIKQNDAGYLSRAKVFGGWLVKHVNDVSTYFDYGEGGTEKREGYEWRSSITFVPDPEYKWEI